MTPNESKSEFDLLYAQACKLQSQKLLDAALVIFLRLWQDRPNHSSVARRIGAVYLGQGKVDLAISYAKKAVDLAPESERASRGLFLSLAEADRDADAWAEAERFLSINGVYPPEYDLMLKEARGEVTDEEFDDIARHLDAKKAKGKDV